MSLATMVLCFSAIRLKDSGLAHLFCLLLLIVSIPLLISAGESAPVSTRVPFITAQENCTSGCNNSVGQISTAEEPPETISSDVTSTQHQSSSPGINAAPTNHSSVLPEANKNEGELLVDSNTTSDLSHTTGTTSSLSPTEGMFTTSSALQQQLLTGHQPPSAAALPRPTTMALPTALTPSGLSMSPSQSATVPPVTSTHTFTTAGISMVTNSPQSANPTETASTHTTTTEELPHPPTTLKATANTKMSPSLGVTSAPSTPAMQTTPLNTATVFLRNSSSTSHKTPSSSATRVSMVEAAGGALTRQLVDTASLMAVLLFGLLFFLVTVAVFVTQAYESYRRKDYTQVDYLINGMYVDSGV
uniref:Chromosome 11 open reading frame 24 n=1 Tax=Nothobranchius kuhntae TaxID=321403 RepID=A0A1A8JYD5_NOTKU